MPAATLRVALRCAATAAAGTHLGGGTSVDGPVTTAAGTTSLSWQWDVFLVIDRLETDWRPAGLKSAPFGPSLRALQSALGTLRSARLSSMPSSLHRRRSPESPVTHTYTGSSHAAVRDKTIRGKGSPSGMVCQDCSPGHSPGAGRWHSRSNSSGHVGAKRSRRRQKEISTVR